MMFWLGVDSDFGLHDQRLNPKEEAIPLAITHMVSFLKNKKGK